MIIETLEELLKLPRNLKEAKLIGSKYYFTNIACKNGHTDKSAVRTRRCITCAKDYSREWQRLRREVPLEIRKQRPGFAERSKEKVRRYKERMQNNPEKYRERNRIRIKEWQSKNRDKVKIYHRNKKARCRKAAGKHSLQDVKELFIKQNNKCMACAISLSLGYHVDHVVPLAKGGTNWPSNLQLLCPTCNLVKQDKDNSEFMKKTMADLL